MSLKRLISLACVMSALIVLFFPSSIYAAPAYDIGDPSSYNAVIGGAANNARLGYYNIGYGNFDNDDKADIVLTEFSSPHAIYVILGSSVTEDKGQLIDMAQSGDYFLKYSPAIADEFNQYYTAYGADLDGNGVDELLIANDNGSEDGVDGRGVVYVIYDSILQSYTGTGNDISLADTDAWNIKLLGANADDGFGGSFLAQADLNQDSLPDMVISALYADNSFSGSGSSYVIYSTLLNTYKSSTGNYLSMSDTANFNYRFDGPTTGSSMISFNLGATDDYDNDGLDDLLLVAPASGYAEAEGGSFFLITNTLFSQVSGTGNTFDLSDTDNFNLRIDSPAAASSLGYSSISMGDINNNQKTDLVLTSSYTSSSFTANGVIFLIQDDILAAYSGTGNIISLLDDSSYTVKYEGYQDEMYLGESTWVGDYDNDNKLDLLTHDYYNVYVLRNPLLSSHLGTGTTIALGEPDTYSYKFTRDGNPFITAYNLADVNGDGTTDFILHGFQETFQTRTNASTNYVLLNFPHQLQSDQSDLSVSGTSVTITGTLNSDSSVFGPRGVQFLVDEQLPDSPRWTNCQASDGVFDTATEEFQCQIDNVASGNHTIYLRAYDEKETYTPSASYAQIPVTIGIQSSGSSISSSLPLPPGCHAFRPTAAPELFQINTNQTTATLYFVPVVNNANSYFVRYGTQPGIFEYGDEFAETSSNGVIVREIGYLKPNTTYYFQIRAGNGCMPGEWGNTLQAKTTAYQNVLQRFFLYFNQKPKL